MEDFEPIPIQFTPAYFFMFLITIMMFLMAYAVGIYAYNKLKDLLPSHVEAGDVW